LITVINLIIYANKGSTTVDVFLVQETKKIAK